MELIGQRIICNLFLFHFLVLNVVSPGHSLNVSSEEQFADFVPEQHMPPSRYHTSADAVPKRGTASSQSHSRWGTQMAFSKTVYSFEVKEDTEPGTVVGKVSTLFDDRSPVTYSVQEDDGGGLFLLSPLSGDFLVSRSLDFEEQSFYVLTVAAQQGDLRVSSVRVYFNVLDVNDNPPVFSQDTFHASLREDTRVGTCFLSLNVSDKDAGDNGDLHLRVTSGDEGSVFFLSPAGTLCLSTQLDRESLSSFSLTVTANDRVLPASSQLTSTAHVIVLVTDVNDNAPAFVSAPSVVVAEDAAPRSVVATVRAEDRDAGSNGEVLYYLKDVSGAFSIGETSGAIQLEEELDREEEETKTITVTATDRGSPSMTSTLNLTVHVQDVNDHDPQFPQSTYSLSVAEDVPRGTSVSQPQAHDRDAGGNGQVRYALTPAAPFAVDVVRGVVVAVEQLDREQLSNYTLIITAFDQGPAPRSATATVSVTVLDVNDFTPVFVPETLVIRVWENEEDQSYLTHQVSAVDEDSEANSQLTYLIEKGNADGLFSITPNGTFQILQTLDREKESLYIITIIAVDSGFPPLTGSLSLHVVVDDTNDNPPEFTEDVYNTIVPEDSPTGTVFAMVTASDVDEGVSGEIRYFMQDTDVPFAIEETSGELFTTNTLDREAVAVYQLSVVGSDKHPTHPLSSSVLVIVLIGDINDHWPRFLNSPYVSYVPDELDPGAVVCAVTATDDDAEINAELRYSLYGQTSDLFVIDPHTGSVFTSGALRNKEDVVVNVHVEDGGENPKFDITTVSVRFQNVSEFPEVSVAVVTDTLSEDAPVGALVATVTAASGRAQPVSFYLAAGNSEDAFHVAPLSGELRLERPLDHESRRSFALLIEARDAGSPPFSSFAQIHLNISDVNDNLPQFTQAEYRCEVLENSPPSWVCDVLAVDADSGSYGAVQYNITDGNTDHFFTIDVESGLLSTSVGLDREYKTEFNLTVEAAEVDNPHHRDRAAVIIVVSDTNDNPPRFSQAFLAAVPEDAPVGHSVLQVTSYDDDIGANAVISYSITDQSDDLPFTIDTTSGRITVERPLDREVQDLYILRVNANDSVWSVSTDVTILITDINDNSPVFVSHFYTVLLPETTETEAFVVQLVATDADLGPNREIVYFMDPLNEEFWVNASTGEVYTKQLLTGYNYTYHFTVFAFDCAAVPLYNSTTVAVRLVPFNHHPPSFLPLRPLIVIPNDMAVGTEVLQLTAVDLDVGNSSANTEYALNGGNASDFFWIQADDGRIFLNQTLADSVNVFLCLSVVAKDRGTPPLSSQTEIMFEITGRNHFPPFFREPDVTFSVPEDLPIGSVIGRIQAEDMDNGANGAIVYSIHPEKPYAPFSIGEASGLLTLVTELDFEILDVYQLQIQATDSGWAPKSSLLNVTVSVMDVNDNPPVFLSSEYLTSLPENSETGTKVLTVTAADADSGAFSQIFYSLTAGHVDKFAIDSRNGTITTLDVFDYEREQVFDLTVRASNTGRQTLFSLAHVVIHISDVNEFTPTFINKEFSFSVLKNVPLRSRIGKVTAIDYDQGPEGQVFYLMFGQNKYIGFEVDELSGEIYTTGSLRKQGNNNVVLKVMAKNAGVITGLNVDETLVHISVIDTNDAPVFTSALYEVNVTEDSPAGTSVLTVSALDQDSILDWNRFFFSIEDGNSNYSFAIDASSGVISVNSPLDRELYPVFNLTVTATDNGSPPATGTSAVIVTIDDVNDNAPKLTYTEAQLKENQPQGTIVARLNAFDADSALNQGPFTFWLVNPLTESPFSLTPDGVLFSTKPTDRELTPTYRILVAVRDSGTPPLSSTTMFHIAIVDENDNPSLPRNIFIEVKYFGSSFQGGMIGNVRPDDQDETDSFSCTIKSGPTNMFIIPNGTCELWSSPFQGEATFNITIEATDHLHYPVNNSIYINYKGFTNASIDNCILFYVSSPSMQEFLSNKYLKFVKALDSLFNLQASKTHVFGIKHIGREILLLAAVKNYNGEYLSQDVASGISSGHKKLLEAQSSVAISHITSDPCLTSPCRNGAMCHKSIFISQSVAVLESLAVIYVSPQKEVFNCTCARGFTGTLCQDDIDECELNPCENDGTCVNMAGSFYCHCRSGFSGSVCSVDGDQCLMLQCQNGGMCIPTQDGYDCRCTPGFEGEMCEQFTDHCTSAPCGQGSCTNSQTGFACQCPFGVSGVHCEDHSYGFEELSFMEFPPLDRRINLISLEFATVQKDSLLLYNPSSSREYLALEILDGTIHLSYDLGSGPVKLQTTKQVADGQFHGITVRRIGNMGSVHVDNCTDVENSGFCFSQNDGSNSQRTLDVGNSNMTFGGLRTIELILLQPTHIKSHDFVGCIRNIQVNGILLRPSMALSTYNILDRCPRAAVSPCHNNPCKNGGVCHDLWSHHHCECRGSFTGSNCARATSEELALRFTSNEYVEYFVKERFRRDFQLKNLLDNEKEENTGDQALINIKFKTKDGGVLISVLTQIGYLLLDVIDGKLVFIFRDTVSGHKSEIAVEPPVADGLWHVVLIISHGQNTLLLLDDNPVLNVTHQMMKFTPVTVEKIVVGAAVTADSKLQHSGFAGCVQYFNATSSDLLVSEHSVMVDIWPSLTLVQSSCSSSGVCIPLACSEKAAAWTHCLSSHCQSQWCGPAAQNRTCICLHNVSNHMCDICSSTAESPDWCHTVQGSSMWLIAVLLPLISILLIVGMLVVLYRVRRLSSQCWSHNLPQKTQHGADNAAFRFDCSRTDVAPEPSEDPQRFSVSEFYCDVNVSSVQFVPNCELEYYETESISSSFHSDAASLKLSWHKSPYSTKCGNEDHKKWGDLKVLLAGFEEECCGEEQAKRPTRPQNAASLYKRAITKIDAVKSLHTPPFYTKTFLQPELLHHVQNLTFEEISKLNIHLERTTLQQALRPGPIRSVPATHVPSDSETESTFTCSESESRHYSVTSTGKSEPDQLPPSAGVTQDNNSSLNSLFKAPSTADQQKPKSISSSMFVEWEKALNMNLPFISYAPIFEEIAQLPPAPGSNMQSDAGELI
ncbi:protocadherin Fat 4 [Betta splendens]|uniref:Protocadherin Fat 4 n=1 Tax=Betta splendens TaxID=158456 RepID=A0A6P7P4A9_BETSP|nr:protocadherin Fat 4 [Betta splendens]